MGKVTKTITLERVTMGEVHLLLLCQYAHLDEDTGERLEVALCEDTRHRMTDLEVQREVVLREVMRHRRVDTGGRPETTLYVCPVSI
jgi:hypothetical protein